MNKLKKLFTGPYNYFFKKDQVLRFSPAEGGLCKKHSKFGARIFQVKTMLIKYNQKRLYNSKSVRPDYMRPYLFLALHTEAKRTTNPAGGYYADQVLILKMLLSVLPDEWMVYIKEHPVQLDINLSSQRPRRSGYYDELRVSDRVRFVDAEEIPFKLIDHAKAVATICGDPGWEAVNRGVPALLFGEAWYQGCEGTFRISSREQCLEAIEAIKSGYRVDHERVRLFWKAIEKSTAEASISMSERKHLGIDYDKNIDTISELLHRELANIRS